MITTVIVVSTVLTVIVLILTLVTISKGYGYKHTIDPPSVKDEYTSEMGNNSEENR